MTTEEKYETLLNRISQIAKLNHVYDEDSQYDYPHHPWDVFSDGQEYGMIMFARTLLENANSN